jgi:hypothetical protein
MVAKIEFYIVVGGWKSKEHPSINQEEAEELTYYWVQ